VREDLNYQAILSAAQSLCSKASPTGNKEQRKWDFGKMRVKELES